jgi:hypothetical protein
MATTRCSARARWPVAPPPDDQADATSWSTSILSEHGAGQRLGGAAGLARLRADRVGGIAPGLGGLGVLALAALGASRCAAAARGAAGGPLFGLAGRPALRRRLRRGALSSRAAARSSRVTSAPGQAQATQGGSARATRCESSTAGTDATASPVQVDEHADAQLLDGNRVRHETPADQQAAHHGDPCMGFRAAGPGLEFSSAAPAGAAA